MLHSDQRSMQQTSTEVDELADLLVAIASGDEAAFEDFYRRTVRRVYGLVRRVLRDEAMSAETTQDVYLLIWSRAHSYNPALGTPHNWLFTLTHRRAVDRVRSESRTTERNARYASETSAMKHDQVDETVIHSMMTNATRGCLASLTPRQAEAINLAYYAGMTYQEVAHELEIKLPALKSRIRDGISRLRDCMELEGYKHRAGHDPDQP